MAKRVTRQFLNNANRHQLKSYLHKLNVETYPDESDNELREVAIRYFELSLAEESPELYSDHPSYGFSP